jgi:hypothetical protein
MNRVVCSRSRPEMATDIVTYRSTSPIPANRNLEGKQLEFLVDSGAWRLLV